jgi:radical SAM-linked protein
MVGEKIRLRFAKTGALRLLSHHDLMRCAERMLRRAEVPFKLTAGFHPSPRIVFALSLPLGVVGRNELVEVELTQPLDDADVFARLNRQAPEGLSFHAAKVIGLKATAVPRRVVYRLPVPPDRTAELADAVASNLAMPKVWVEKSHPKPRRVNVRPYLRDVAVGPDSIALDLWVTGQGTARAEDLLRHLGLADVLDDGAVLERTDLEVHDEAPPDAADGPPDGPPETLPLNHAPASAGVDDDRATGTWGLSPNGPVVE